MRSLRFIGALALACALATVAHAGFNDTSGGNSQGMVLEVQTSSNPNTASPVDNTHPVSITCVSGCGGSGGTASAFAAAFPANGTAIGFYFGGNMTYAGVDASHNVDVNCVVGCSGGTFNNNSDAVATSATNGQTAAWLYGFNGTTWDRLEVDGSKNLKVVVGGSLPAFAATPTVNLGTLNGIALDTSVGTTNTDLGAPGATACATDTGSCSMNALAQRLSQRLTTINTTLGSPFQAGGSIGNTAFGLSMTTVTPTDRGSTLTTGGTAQNAMASNASRKDGWIQNPCSATEDLFISTTTTATTTGAGDDADLAPCASFGLMHNGLVVTAAVSVNAATSGHRWLAKETQ